MFVLFKNILIFISAMIDLKIIIQKENSILQKLQSFGQEAVIKGNEKIEELV